MRTRTSGQKAQKPLRAARRRQGLRPARAAQRQARVAAGLQHGVQARQAVGVDGLPSVGVVVGAGVGGQAGQARLDQHVARGWQGRVERARAGDPQRVDGPAALALARLVDGVGVQQHLDLALQPAQVGALRLGGRQGEQVARDGALQGALHRPGGQSAQRLALRQPGVGGGVAQRQAVLGQQRLHGGEQGA
ncbi:hypothetical protein [Ottowia sp.]|uniref:hypothetical protein n=1 Tax=Ottowia sp. TaxID=1898956 RepID=UPI0025D510D8|nr:hypothetical protein [Ottowia sp.]MBK6748251.1 hypothetical protein [Ottowia sp.]